MLEKVKRVAFAALCMCVCVSMKVRAEEYLIDEGMAVAESITVKLESGKAVPGGFEKYVAYTDARMATLALYNETEARIEVDTNGSRAQITSKLNDKKGRFIQFWSWYDLNEYLNSRKESGWKANVDLNSIGIPFAEVKATNQTFKNSEGVVVKNPCYTENNSLIETKPEPEPEPEPGPGPGTGGEGGSGEGESSNVPWYKRIIEMIASIPEKLIEGIKALFVPSEKALEEHEWLFNEKFNFWSGIKEQFEKIVGMLQGNGIPPKIEMDLSRIGAGKVTVLNFEGIDLTLFKKLESAFLWLSYILLLFRNVTGIIKGETTEVKE